MACLTISSYLYRRLRATLPQACKPPAALVPLHSCRLSSLLALLLLQLGDVILGLVRSLLVILNIVHIPACKP